MLELNGTVVVLLISFLAFIWALDLVFVKPVSKVLEARAAKIEKDLEASKASRTEADLVLVDYQKRLAEVRSKAQSIINEGVTASQKVRNEEISKVQASGRQKLEAARIELAEEKKGLVDQLVDREIELVNIIMGKLIGSNHVASGLDRSQVKKALEEAC
ncbi:MAG: ATP synthase F0 subunit B [Candidatus Obscuribacterales bacterium]|jgi:F-type H+-transporting ATPase subunit b